MNAPARLRADRKLFLSYLVLIGVVVAALTLGVGSTLRRQLTGMALDDLRRELFLAVFIHRQSPRVPPDELADRLGALSGRRVTLIARDGTVLGDSERDGAALAAMENHSGRPEIRVALRGEVGQSVRFSTSLRTEEAYVAAPSARGEVVRMAFPLRDMNRAVARVQRGIFGVGAVALAFAGLLSFAFSVAVTRPLRQVVSVARDLARGDLSRRVNARDRSEIGELGRVLDSLAEELQRRLGQLEGERAEMQALIDTMSEGVVAIGPDGAVRRANPAARRMFGLADDPRGRTPREVAHRPEFLRLVERAVGGEQVAATELPYDGWRLLATAQPLAGGGAVLVFLDVSALRRLEDARRDFVANASHELKTPLTAIRGYSETLLDEGLPPELRRRFAEVVKANADRLQRIVDDLLDLSRIESGGWRAEPEPVAVGEAAGEAWSGLEEEAEERGVRFEVEIAPDCGHVLADPSALRQIFINLLHNSLRHTPAGGEITVAAGCAPPRRGRAPGRWVQIEVRDTGCGIPAAHLPRIFERFYRVDTGRSRAEGGTGLGLAIVRHLVESHGGHVEAESEMGRGTKIRFTLPAADEVDG
ncbi:MAG TPA: ATP-binding protein [Longimicrobiaceae bacterium]|nr:ATP-binding protein [Longimicrobiaceae bacterium]